MRFQVQCIPGRDEDGPGWWCVVDTLTPTAVTVWPHADEPSPLREVAVLIAEAYNEAHAALVAVRSEREGPPDFLFAPGRPR